MPATLFRMTEQTFDDLIRTEIRAEMARQRISQRQLAARLHWSPTTLHRRLSGTSPLGAEHLFQIAKALKVTVSDLGYPLVTTSGKGVR